LYLVAIFIPTGPDPSETERLRDLLESIKAVEPALTDLLLIDDAPQSRDLDKLAQEKGFQSTTVLSGPRRPYFQRGFSSLTSMSLQALSWFVGSTTAKAMVKMDTDALAIKPFSRRILAFHAEFPDFGMMGDADRTANGEILRYADVLYSSIQRRWRWGLRTTVNSFLRNSFKTGRQRNLMGQAYANGYTAGELCQGGAYSVSRVCALKMADCGLLTAPDLWSFTDLGWSEDILMTAYCYITGLKHCVDQDIICSAYKQLRYPPKELQVLPFALIHSIKDSATQSESQIRGFFKEQRESGVGGEREADVCNE
jgi:hypothetical protein